MEQTTFFKFSKTSDIKSWKTIQDVVMGGLSEATITLSDQGFGEYSGKVSLENNGGFSSLHYKFHPYDVSSYTRVLLKLKGDGKKYQFRIKENQTDQEAYIYKFETSGDWEVISVPLKDMYPTFRGRKLEMSNFDKKSIAQIAFLIANKTEENFKLLISSIAFM